MQNLCNTNANELQNFNNYNITFKYVQMICKTYAIQMQMNCKNFNNYNIMLRGQPTSAE